MPKLKPKTKKRRAQVLSKLYIKSGLNSAAVARKRGVSRQVINQQVNSPAVQDELSNFLESKDLKETLVAVAKDGLLATKSNGITILLRKKGKKGKKGKTVKQVKEYRETDHNARHRYWHDLMMGAGKIKTNGEKKVPQIVNIIYGHRVATRHPDSALRKESNNR